MNCKPALNVISAKWNLLLYEKQWGKGLHGKQGAMNKCSSTPAKTVLAGQSTEFLTLSQPYSDKP